MKLAAACFFLLLGAACENKLSGSLELDGQLFELDSCRSGQVYGFSGVELRDKDGNKLRLVQTPTGDGQVILMPKGSETGIDLGTCGPFQVSTQNSTINDVKNVEGRAKLECSTGGHTLKGKVSFSNCH
jgi:hypothetical protein